VTKPTNKQTNKDKFNFLHPVVKRTKRILTPAGTICFEGKKNKKVATLFFLLFIYFCVGLFFFVYFLFVVYLFLFLFLFFVSFFLFFFAQNVIVCNFYLSLIRMRDWQKNVF
jgi:hypothetical protein